MTVVVGQAVKKTAGKATAGATTAKKATARPAVSMTKATPAATPDPDPAPAPRPAAATPQRGGGNPADVLNRVPDGPGFRVGGFSTNLAGAAVAVILWGWVALPFLNPPKGRGRAQAVADVLRAKLTNRGIDGQELP